MLFMTYCTYIDLRENCMLQVNNTNQIQYHMGFTSNPVKNSAEEGVKISEQDKGKKYASMYFIGTTALASVIMLGVLGRNGKLGSKLQKFLGGKTEQTIKNITNPQDNARKVLGELYEKVITKAQKDGNTRRVNIFKQCKDNINSLDTQTMYGNLIDALYKDLRLGEYPISALVTKNIEEITAKGTASIKVKNQNGWHYRMPIARKSGKSVDRISINALADENLIKSLDDLFASGKVKGYYKTPDTNLNWLERHDPITIYLDEKATPETLDAVKVACEKYIRSTEDVLSGKKFASGMALQKSPEEKDIKAVLEQAKDIDPILEDVLRKQFTDTKSGKLIMSAGYMDSVEKLMNLIK